VRQPRHPGSSEITLTGVLSALGDPIRLRIVRVLADGGEHPRRDFEFDLAQSTISHHMKILRDAGIMWVRNEGTRCSVSLRDELDQLFPGVLPSILAADEKGRTGQNPGC
jgi:DNA-binding transcriptional ArsR family regulator